MGALGNAIRAALAFNFVSGRKNTAAHARAALGSVADAVDFLEGLQRGAKILRGTAAPSSATGLDGDAYINTATSDYYLKDSGAWSFVFRLKGDNGTTPQKGIDYFDGTTPRKGIDYFDGQNGKSTYQLWLDAGNVGSLQQFLAAQKGTDGEDGENGADGSVNQWHSYAPTNEPAQPGSAWFHTISATKLAIYECVTAPDPSTGFSTWGLRFTSPEPVNNTTSAPSSGGTAGVASFNTRAGAVTLTAADVQAVVAGGTLNSDGKLVVGSALTIEQDLASNSAANVPSVAAVKAAVAGVLNYSRFKMSVTQTTTLVPIYFKQKVQLQAIDYNFNVASVSFEVSYLDTNGDETKLGPFASLGGGSGINAAINGLSSTVLNVYGYTVRVLHVLKAGKSSAESSLDIIPTV
jgi:hypothetical protein